MTSPRIVKIDPLNIKQDYIKEAGDILANGGLVIIPTETVYGIAANMLNKKTLERLYEIKNRPRSKPFSLHIDDKELVEDLAGQIPVSAYKLMDKFWPGPLTLILKAKENNTIGIRMPDNEIALRVIRASGVPVVCPSANISGNPAPVNFEAAIKDMKGLVDFAIDAGSTKLQTESSVIDLTTSPSRILREGAIKKEDIESVLNKKTVLFVCSGNSCRSVMAKGILEKRLKEKNRKGVEVLSAGMMMVGGFGATDETKELLKREGIDVSGHRSQRVAKEMVDRSDIILVMEKLHEQRILQLAPEAKNRLFLLKEFAKIQDNNLDIADPIGRPVEFYGQTFQVIKEAIDKIMEII